MIGDLRAETVRIEGDGGDEIEAYLAVPLDGRARAAASSSSTTCPATTRRRKEITRRFAAHGYLADLPQPLHPRGARRRSRTTPPRRPGPPAACPDERLVGDVAGAAALPAVAARVQRQGRRRSATAPAAASRCSPRCSLRPRRRRRLLRRVRDRHPAGGLPAAPGAADRPAGRAALPAARACSAPRTSTRRRSRSPSSTGCSPRPASRTSSTATTAPATRFFAVDRPAYRPEAANDGWQRIWDFFGRTWHLGARACAPTRRRTCRSRGSGKGAKAGSR